jgi:chromosome segregation ATPase
MSVTFEKPLEQRVEELESLVWEFPTLMNLRFERFDTEFTSMRSSIEDNTRRLSQVERGFNLIQADIRDLRNGMTRLVGSLLSRMSDLEGRTQTLEKEVAGMRAQIGRLDEKVGGIETKITNLDSRVASLETKVTSLETKVTSLDTKMDEVLSLLRGRG